MPTQMFSHQDLAISQEVHRDVPLSREDSWFPPLQAEEPRDMGDGRDQQCWKKARMKKTWANAKGLLEFPDFRGCGLKTLGGPPEGRGPSEVGWP